jgi:hypothetical protein
MVAVDTPAVTVFSHVGGFPRVLSSAGLAGVVSW